VTEGEAEARRLPLPLPFGTVAHTSLSAADLRRRHPADIADGMERSAGEASRSGF
jgi:hypothetical protein